MKTKVTICTMGMQALIAALGQEETERFMAAPSRDKFDYIK